MRPRQGIVVQRLMTAFHFRIIGGCAWADQHRLDAQADEPEGEESGKRFPRLSDTDRFVIVCTSYGRVCHRPKPRRKTA